MPTSQRLHRLLLLFALFLVWVGVSACASVQAAGGVVYAPQQAAPASTSPTTSPDDDDDDGGLATMTATPSPTTTPATATASPTPAASPSVTLTASPDDDDDGGPATATPTPPTTPATATVSPTLSMTPAITLTVIPNDDDGPIIVIEGPVTAININIITIYNFDIVIEASNPVLQVIRIGDVIRVSGRWDWDDDDDDDDGGQRVMRISTPTITFINVTVVISDDLIWRDPGDCSGIPAWVTHDQAAAYFIRCVDRQIRPGSGGGGDHGGGGGRGRDDDDDDDDD